MIAFKISNLRFQKRHALWEMLEDIPYGLPKTFSHCKANEHANHELLVPASC